ncbi:MAG TPA: methyltransferase domain-containing protein [Candidatus Methylomirabilis sp.]|nr:methyltransferase domain-containing protein [Candidatus Methylomirabilis sp.]
MRTPAWETFFNASVRHVLRPGFRVLDIGAGLRVDSSRGNVVDASRDWIKPLLSGVSYQVLDPVDTYHPDIVGDVMDMPQVRDASYDAIICLAVLEHVPRPWDAVREMHRALKPGGMLFLYVPFLSPYHAMPGYYGDYVRFTDDGLRSLCADFVDVKLSPVRGPVETLTHLIPGRTSVFRNVGRFLDRYRKGSGKQASGYFLTALKPA